MRRVVITDTNFFTEEAPDEKINEPAEGGINEAAAAVGAGDEEES